MNQQQSPVHLSAQKRTLQELQVIRQKLDQLLDNETIYNEVLLSILKQFVENMERCRRVISRIQALRCENNEQ